MNNKVKHWDCQPLEISLKCRMTETMTVKLTHFDPCTFHCWHCWLWFSRGVYYKINRGLPAEADMLIERLKSDTRIDWEKDWKMVTLLIGGNNLCDYCWNRVNTMGRLYTMALPCISIQIAHYSKATIPCMYQHFHRAFPPDNAYYMGTHFSLWEQFILREHC